MALLGTQGTIATVTARFEGDAQRNAAQASRTIKVTTPTRITLTASAAELAWKGSVELSGELTDGSGPVGGAQISIVALGANDEARALTTGVTDAAGRFSISFAGGSERPGTLFLEARHHPTASFREPSHSAALSLTVLAPEPRSLVFYISPLLTLLAIAAIQLLRRRPWRARGEKPPPRRRARAPSAAAGLTESRAPLLSTLRAPHDLGLSGQVCELPSGAPVPTAIVVLTTGGVQRELAVDHEGRFAVEELPAGAILVEVGATGYVPERFERTLPHRGELRRARVLLIPIREKIFSAYRQVATPLLPSPQLAETWTPRELLHHMERKVLIVDELAALTKIVEEACFGPRMPDGAALSEAERLAGLVAGRAPKPSLTA